MQPEVPPKNSESKTLGTRVFDLLPEFVSGKTYDRERIAESLLSQVRKEPKKINKSLRDRVVEAVFLSEDIDPSMKVEIFKHLGEHELVESLGYGENGRERTGKENPESLKDLKKRIGRLLPEAVSDVIRHKGKGFSVKTNIARFFLGNREKILDLILEKEEGMDGWERDSEKNKQKVIAILRNVTDGELQSLDAPDGFREFLGVVADSIEAHVPTTIDSNSHKSEEKTADQGSSGKDGQEAGTGASSEKEMGGSNESKAGNRGNEEIVKGGGDDATDTVSASGAEEASPGSIDWGAVKVEFDRSGGEVTKERERKKDEGELKAELEAAKREWSSKQEMDAARKSFDEETEQLKKRDKLAERLGAVKDFRELMVLLNNPEFPGIQGSDMFYSGEELWKRASEAMRTGDMKYLTRSHGFRDTVDRLFRDTVDRLLNGGQDDRTGTAKEDSIIEGLGVVSDVEEIPDEPLSSAESAIAKRNAPSEEEVARELEEARRTADRGTEALVDGRESSPDQEQKKEERESIETLRNRVAGLKEAADKARDAYLRLKRRNESKWYDVRKYLFRTKENQAAIPDNLAEEIQSMEANWKHALTEYKDARLLLAKREFQESPDGKRRTHGEVMADALQEMEFSSSIENYNAWKNSAWGEKKEASWFLRALGKTEEWAEEYRKLDWKKRIAVSAAVAGIGITGAVVGSAGIAGIGVAGGFALRLLGSYGAGRGIYEFLETRANRKLTEGHEASLEAAKEFPAFRVLELRTRDYAEKMVQNLAQAEKENRRRARIGVVSGVALFTVGSAFAYRSAIADMAGKVKGLFVPGMPEAASGSGRDSVVPSVGETPVISKAPLSEGTWGATTSEQKQNILKNLRVPGPDEAKINSISTPSQLESVEMKVIPKGISIEKVLGGNAEAHRQYLAFLNKLAEERGGEKAKLDALFQKGMRPGDRILTVPGTDGNPRIVGIERLGKGGGTYFLKGYEGLQSGVHAAVSEAEQAVGDATQNVDKPLTVERFEEVRLGANERGVDLKVDLMKPIPPGSDAVKGAALAGGSLAAGALFGRAAVLDREGSRGNSKAVGENGGKAEEKGNEGMYGFGFEKIFRLKEVHGRAREAFKRLREISVSQIDVTAKTADTRKEICRILFDASEQELESSGVLERDFQDVLNLKPENKNDFFALQILFRDSGDMLPLERILFRPSREVVDIVVERFLTGKIPDRIYNS